MRTICLYFQVHQPLRFRRYRFFDIGKQHYYYDDYMNESILRKVADKCYLPANKIILDLIREYGTQLKINFSITGIAMDQFELYAPEVLESFQDLAKTGCVEFLGETYSHSLAALKNKDEFIKQVKAHSDKIFYYFNQQPSSFRNTELIYSDDIGEMVYAAGFDTMITEGANHILGWKSPNFLYANARNPRLKVLLKNFKLSDDIAFRFSDKNWNEYPLTAKKYVQWLDQLDPKEEVINLFMDYETFGEHQDANSGIFNFLKAFPKEVFENTNYTFSKISEAAKELQPIGTVHVPYPVSWADEERDLTAWLGNDLQEEAFNKLYQLSEQINQCNDETIKTDWKYLQASDHFYYMCTKFFSDMEVHSYFNPYESPYDAFINYMNILSDFTIRVNASVPKTDKDKEISNLLNILVDRESELEKVKSELRKIKNQKKTVSPKATKNKTVTKTKPKAAKPKTSTRSKSAAKTSSTTAKKTGAAQKRTQKSNNKPGSK